MQIFIDSDFCCHAMQDASGTLRAIEVPELDGNCRAFVEGMRYVPQGETWTRPDGVVFDGPMLAPCKDLTMLEMAQATYEDALAAMRAELQPQIDDVLVALVEG